MQAIDGWSPMDGGWQSPFDTDFDARRGLAFQLVEGAAKLGRVDWRAQGLEGFGRPDGFHERQVDRWLAFLDAYKVRELAGPGRGRRLAAQQPAGALPAGHHARRLPVRQRDVRARRAGAPGRDRGLGDDDGRRSAARPGLVPAGLRRRKAARGRVLSRHARHADAQRVVASTTKHVSGLSTENIDYYLVLANWKLGIVLEKTYAAGVRTGKVDPKITDAFGPMIPQLIATAAELAGLCLLTTGWR